MTTQILIVDDDQELRDLLRDYLVRQGMEVSVLHDAASLEKRLERERPDLIVLDLMMPGVDGLTAPRLSSASLMRSAASCSISRPARCRWTAGPPRCRAANSRC